ncbi:MAG: hypothetical protein J7L54_03770 [Elusimicrobia bacterium]|nr:hypothetical protein [Elusimicrobiota bacterium]
MKPFFLLLSFFIISSCAILPRRETVQEISVCSNRDYYPELKNLIKNVRRNIYISHLYFHLDEITRPVIFLLNKAIDKGVDVRGIFEDNVVYNKESLSVLKSIGADVKLDSADTFSHSKFIVCDGKSVLVGSTNLSFTSIQKNNETDVFIKDPRVANWFERYFLAEFQGSKFPETAVYGEVTCIKSGEVDEFMRKLFDEAKEKIKVIIYGIKIYADKESSVMEVVSALVSAAEKGVPVEVVIEKSDYDRGLNEINAEGRKYFEAAGIKVFYDDPHTITHAKLVIADDSVIVGSSNWGYGGFQRYREANVLIKDRKIADYFEKYFEKVKRDGEKEWF